LEYSLNKKHNSHERLKKWLYGNVHHAEQKKKADVNQENVIAALKTVLKRKAEFFIFYLFCIKKY
jgi:hypothetical protein